MRENFDFILSTPKSENNGNGHSAFGINWERKWIKGTSEYEAHQKEIVLNGNPYTPLMLDLLGRENLPKTKPFLTLIAQL